MLEEGVGAGEGVERGGDHELEIALGEDDVGVLPVEDFALLGDAQFAGEAVDGLGEDGAVGGATAAAYRSSATVEEAQADAALAGHLVQCAVRLPYLPGAGDHASVLVGVGVAEHNLLLMVPGHEQRLVGGGGPELAADGGCVAQVVDGFEERDGLKAGIGAVWAARQAATAFDADSGEAGEPQDLEHVFGGGGAADDVAGERFGDVEALQFGDGAEGVEDLAGLRSEGGGKLKGVGEGLWCLGRNTGVLPLHFVQGQDDGIMFAGDLGEFGDGGGVDARVLADVEGVQVEAVGADLDEQRIDERLGEAAATVADEAGVQHHEIGDELRSAGVGLERRAGRGRDGDLRRSAEAHHDAADEQAHGLEWKAGLELGLAGGAQLLHVAFEQRGELGRDGDLLGGAGELVGDVLQAAAVVGKEQAMGHGEGDARGARSDEGIAIAVAADPGTEGDEAGQIGEVGLDAVLGGQGCGDFGVEHGKRGEDGGLEVVQRHADLVAHGGAGHADIVGLPEGGDLGDDVLLDGFEFGLGDGDAVELLQQGGDAAALGHDGAARDFGGVRGEDRRDGDAGKQGAGFIRRDSREL